MKVLEEVLMAEGYPNVECSLHPGPAKPGYSVCLHVRGGGDVVMHQAPSEKELGLIVCGECAKALTSGDPLVIDRATDMLALSCAQCVRYNLAGKLPS